MNNTFTLENAVEKNQQYPDTFHIPSSEDIQALKEGDYVKLIFKDVVDEAKGGERMWVRITDVNGAEFSGILDNEPLDLDVEIGTPITFKAEHIISTMVLPF